MREISMGQKFGMKEGWKIKKMEEWWVIRKDESYKKGGKVFVVKIEIYGQDEFRGSKLFRKGF